MSKQSLYEQAVVHQAHAKELLREAGDALLLATELFAGCDASEGVWTMTNDARRSTFKAEGYLKILDELITSQRRLNTPPDRADGL